MDLCEFRGRGDDSGDLLIEGGTRLEARCEPIPPAEDQSNGRKAFKSGYLPRYVWHSLSAHHFREGLDLGGVVGGRDGVKGSEGGRRLFRLEIHHVEDGTDGGVGGESLHHEVCVGVFLGDGLVFEHGGEKRGQLLERVAFNATPDLVNRKGG